ncbi:MAG: c-type cytochrome biogenesis protein CcmI [Phyllobacterium sp.]
MYFWIASALLTFGATIAVLIPLTRRSEQSASGSRYDAEVYRDQMREVEADKQRGLIDADSAEQARAEIGRRLLQAAKQSEAEEATSSTRTASGRWIVFAAVMAIPILSWGVYARLGSPDLPSQPLAERLARAPGESTPEELVARAETHLAANPDDGRGWDVLAPIYLRMGRFEEAVNAYRNSIRLNGDTAARQLGLGQALLTLSDGNMTEGVEAAFRRAIELDPTDIRPHFFIAGSLVQQGKQDEAAALIRDLLAKAPSDAPWRGEVEAALADIENRASAQSPAPQKGPSSADIDAAQGMSAEDRSSMIEGMVASLDARLKENPDDLEGWKQLIRSYDVLGKKTEAADALARAIAVLDAQKGSDLSKFGESLGISLPSPNSGQ